MHLALSPFMCLQKFLSLPAFVSLVWRPLQCGDFLRPLVVLAPPSVSLDSIFSHVLSFPSIFFLPPFFSCLFNLLFALACLVLRQWLLWSLPARFISCNLITAMLALKNYVVPSGLVGSCSAFDLFTRCVHDLTWCLCLFDFLVGYRKLQEPGTIILDIYRFSSTTFHFSYH